MPVLGYKAFFWAEVCMAPSRNSVSKEDIFSRKMEDDCSKRKGTVFRGRANEGGYQRFRKITNL